MEKKTKIYIESLEVLGTAHCAYQYIQLYELVGCRDGCRFSREWPGTVTQ